MHVVVCAISEKNGTTEADLSPARLSSTARHIGYWLLASALLACIVCKPVFSSQTLLSMEDTKHLLSRTGFGASVGELNRFIGKTRQQSVDLIVSGIRSEPQVPMPEWTSRPAPHHWARKYFSKQARREFNEARDREMAALRVWWVKQMIETRTPQSERLVLMWHNHFATAYSGIDSQAIAMARQHQLFRTYGTGSLEDLLKQMIRDPALLNYLDNDRSRKKAPNENLARELLELFTMGEGQYLESDIKSAARALTGYSVEAGYNLQFRFKHRSHDDGNKTLFGQSGSFNGDDLVDLVLQQPQTALFITHRFWRTYISDLPADPKALQQLAASFRDSGYNLETLYRETLLSDAFWHPQHRASIVRSPVSLVIGTVRSTGLVPEQWQTLPAILASLGQNLFDPPNVAGWPGGGNWVTPSRLLNRLDWLTQVANGCATPNCTTASDSAAMPPDNMAGDNSNKTDALATGMSMNSMSDASVGNNTTSTTAKSSSNSAPTAMMANGNKQHQQLLSIRLASEDYDEAVQYQLSIYRNKQQLWTTGSVSVAGGHDSKRLGRMSLEENTPWQVVDYTVDANVAGFDSIEVEFLNDAAANGADRNLFVDQVVFNGQRFFAAKGVQSSGCPPGQAHHAGRLYCNGTLRLTNHRATPLTATATTTATKPEQSSRSSFSASGVYLKHTRTPEIGKNRHFSVSLTDVTLNNRHWHNITASFYHQGKPANPGGNKPGTDKINAYALRLDNFSCWPDCVQIWPQCAWKDKRDADKLTLSFPLPGNGDTDCHYKSLALPDQSLVNALWFNAENIYQLAHASTQARKPEIAEQFSHWSDHIATMSHIYKQSHYRLATSEPPPSLTLAEEKETVYSPVDSLYQGKPRPGGLSVEQQESDWLTLRQQFPDLSLTSLLLPIQPVPPAAQNQALPAVLGDLSFQLK